MTRFAKPDPFKLDSSSFSTDKERVSVKYFSAHGRVKNVKPSSEARYKPIDAGKLKRSKCLIDMANQSKPKRKHKGRVFKSKNVVRFF